MTIGLFTDIFDPTIGGTETAIQQMYSGLKALGHEVYIVAPAAKGFCDTNPDVIRLPAFQSPLIPDGHHLVWPTTRLSSQFDSIKFDIIHSQTEFGLGLLADMVARRQHIPHVHTLHTILPELLSKLPATRALISIGGLIIGRYRRRIAMPQPAFNLPASLSDNQRAAWVVLLEFMSFANAVTVPSQALKADLEAYGLKTKLFHLPNSVNIAQVKKSAQGSSNRLKLNPKAVTIVTVGRLSPEKRQHELLQATNYLPASPVWQLVVVGAGESLLKLQQFARSLTYSERIIFTGSLPHDETLAIMQHSQALVLASHGFDNHPMVFLEAMALGLPIVYCDPRLSSELTPQGSLLASSAEPEGLAAALQRIITDAALQERLAVAAGQHGRMFDSTVIAKQQADLYKQLITDYRK